MPDINTYLSWLQETRRWAEKNKQDIASLRSTLSAFDEGTNSTDEFFASIAESFAKLEKICEDASFEILTKELD